MKKVVTLLLVFFFGIFKLTSQDILWTGHISSTDEVIPLKSIMDSNDNLYILGKFKSNLNYSLTTLNSNGGSDIFLLKLEKNGNINWAINIGSDQNDLPSDIALANNNSELIVSGSFTDTCFFN
ncbi:MAG: hypothetical protein ACLFUC_07730 [Bacteroidales bacterium]